jgi:tripartite ATP-independent transporter DctM subunit
MFVQVGVLLGGMTLLMLSGLPIFFGMILSVLMFWALFPDVLPGFIIGQSFVQGIDSYSFAAIPFFFLAGEIMNAGGMSTRLLRLAQALVGHVRGGLSHVNILANMVMAGVSGSAAADASAIGSVLAPAMKREGYGAAYAAAVTASAATIGPMIPPSIPLVIYGLISGASVGKLFLGGVVPGLLMGVFLLCASGLISRRRNYPKSAWGGWARVGRSFLESFAALMMPVLVVLGLIGGVATATEIGAVAVAYAIVVSVFVYRELAWTALWKVTCKSAVDSCVVLIIASAAGAFTWIIGSIGVGRELAAAIGGLTSDPRAVLLIICVVLLVAGTVLEPITTLLVLIPLFLPLCARVGIDLVHFGIVTVLATLIGMCLPPIGFLIYLTAAQAQADVVEVTRELLPFVIALVLLLFVVAMIPALSLWLPAALMHGQPG